MADAVVTKTIYSSTQKLVIQITNRSDGTGESTAIKVDKSTLIGPVGVEPTSLALISAHGNVDGMTVALLWDHTTDIKICDFSQGYNSRNFSAYNGVLDTGTGQTGDVILTTTGHSSGDSYDLVLEFRLVA